MADEGYAQAGYKPNRSKASKLTANHHIKDRNCRDLPSVARQGRRHRRPHRGRAGQDIADAARYITIVARHIAPKALPKADLPPGVALPDLTMDQFMDIEDSWSKRPDRV